MLIGSNLIKPENLLKMFFFFFQLLIHNCSYYSTAVGALKKLVQIGWETIIITMGENGAVYTTKDSNDCIHVLADKVKPVDTTVSIKLVNCKHCFLFLCTNRQNNNNIIITIL